MAVVWPGMVIEGSNLPVQVAALRRLLDEGRADGRIQTIPSRGYRFVAPAMFATARARACQSSCCPFPMSAKFRTSNIWQMGSQRT